MTIECKCTLQGIDPNGPMREMTDLEIIQAMQNYGGEFVKALARAALLADGDNLRRMKETWSEYWFKYSAVAEEVRQINHSKAIMERKLKSLPK